MALFSTESLQSLRLLWKTISGWDELKQFLRIYLSILRRPIKNTIELHKQIPAADAFKFFVQSFVFFTLIVSLFTVFRGNDVLKGILLMLNQIVFLTLATALYYLFFRWFSGKKKNFTEFLSLYTLYMGFIMPFFAFGSYLNWNVILMVFDPAYRISPPSPLKAISLLLSDFLFIGFAVYYSTKIHRYFWGVSTGIVVIVLVIVFILLSPLQRYWMKAQCKMGIVPEFAFTNLAHRRATYAILGCENVDCQKCLIPGVWYWSKESADKIGRDSTEQLNFTENGYFRANVAGTPEHQASTTTSRWFINDDGKEIFFFGDSFELLELSTSTMKLVIQPISKDGLLQRSDTLILEHH